jgi:hypothetical protein
MEMMGIAALNPSYVLNMTSGLAWDEGFAVSA